MFKYSRIHASYYCRSIARRTGCEEQGWLSSTELYIHWNGHRGKFGRSWLAAILIGILERIRSIRARAAIVVLINVLSYGNLYGHEWYVNKNKCHFNFISIFNKIILITLFISYIINTCAGIDIFNTKILTYEIKYSFYFFVHIQAHSTSCWCFAHFTAHFIYILSK